jgi:hypothetical protein
MGDLMEGSRDLEPNVVKSVLQHFIARLPSLDPAPLPAKDFLGSIEWIADRGREDPRDPTQMQQSFLFFIPVMAQAHDNLAFLVQFISGIHDTTRRSY